MICIIPKREASPQTKLINFWKNLTVLESVGRNSSTVAAIGMDGPTNGTRKRMFMFYNGRFKYWNTVRSDTGTLTYYGWGYVPNDGINGVGTYRQSTNGIWYIYKYNSNYTSGSSNPESFTNPNTQYSGTIVNVEFPDYTSNDTFAFIPQKSVGTSIAGRDASTTGAVSTTNKSHTLILCAKNNLFDVRRGDTWEKIAGTASNAASISGSTLTLGNCYGGTIVALDPV